METEISTHALTEGDRKDMFCSSVCMNFNSRPHGGRPSSVMNTCSHFGISTHALTEGDRDLVWHLKNH